jgi:dihydroxyacetone kinase-like protein
MEYVLNKDATVVVYNLVKCIQENKDYLREVDGAIGDGDHGINMNKGFTICGQRIDGKELSMSKALEVLSQVLMMEIGGSMGPLYGMLFEGFYEASSNEAKIDKKVFGSMLQSAYESLKEISGADVGDKTLMDVLIPANNAYQETLLKGASFTECLEKMCEAAETGKESTRDLVAKVGRASRLGERSRGILDAGATSCNLILQSMGDTFISLLNEK